MNKLKNKKIAGHVERMSKEHCMQNFCGEAWRQQTTWKA